MLMSIWSVDDVYVVDKHVSREFMWRGSAGYLIGLDDGCKSSLICRVYLTVQYLHHIAVCILYGSWMLLKSSTTSV